MNFAVGYLSSSIMSIPIVDIEMEIKNIANFKSDELLVKMYLKDQIEPIRELAKIVPCLNPL